MTDSTEETPAADPAQATPAPPAIAATPPKTLEQQIATLRSRVTALFITTTVLAVLIFGVLFVGAVRHFHDHDGPFGRRIEMRGPDFGGKQQLRERLRDRLDKQNPSQTTPDTQSSTTSS
jgi:hypothetical protein